MSELKVHASACDDERMVHTDELRSAFVARLKKALTHAGIGEWGAGAYLANATGKTAKAASKWINAESMPGRANMLRIAEDLGVRVEWLQFGEGSMVTTADTHNKNDKESNVIAADFSGKAKLKDGELSIPQYNVRGALGHGQIPADYIETIRHVTVHESMLSGRGISFSKADNLAIITGFGQSMEGTINDGDPLIVDRGISQFIGDGIYVLTWDNLLYVKRLQKHSPTQFDMISDNPLHKDQVINIADVTIHARVLLVWNAKKL